MSIIYELKIHMRTRRRLLRARNRELDMPTSEKDRKKLERLDSDEKLFVNASRKTGKTYVFQMGEDGE